MHRPVKSPLLSRTSSAPCANISIGLRALLTLVLALNLPLGCSEKKAASCDESKCQTGQRCVQTACRPSCAKDADCSAGQSCALWGFADGSRGTYCVVLPGSDTGAAGAASAGKPTGSQCSSNAECQAEQGQSCISGTCRVACTSHFDCLGLGECTSGTDTNGTAGHFCDLSLPQSPGQFYTRCPSGTGSECDTNDDFFCVGAGADDLDAYCTTDCSSDDACAPGFTCAPLNRSPCSNDCPQLQSKPDDRMCVPSDQIGVGRPFQCSSHGVTRNVCRPREFCTSCTNDSDCLATPNQICAADQSGAKICTEVCDIKHPSCPWGSAAECGLWDRDLGLPTCAHRFGKCVGTGKSCEPCEQDSDCGAQGACTSSTFTGEHWCVDLSVTCSCNGMADANNLCSGGGCPLSPSGLTMLCEDDSTATSSVRGECVGANTVTSLLSSSEQTGCWPAR